jgi:hypothetical protein
MPTYTFALLDCSMACLLFVVECFTVNVWLCVARHVIHDTEEAGRLKLAGSHSV